MATEPTSAAASAIRLVILTLYSTLNHVRLLHGG
jgi:hypothetical protein